MSTTIDFNALYAEAKRAATKHGAVVDPQYGARKSATQPAEGLASQVVEETEAKCVYLDANGNLEAGSLANYRIGDIPAAYYLPDFITEVEEHRLLSEVILLSGLCSLAQSPLTLPPPPWVPRFTACLRSAGRN